MKKYITLSFAALLCIFVSGCDFSPVYQVSIVEEAIVTQDGNIIGAAKKPGYHFKIPVIQKAHLIDVRTVRELDLPVPNSSSLQARMLWSIKDPKKYYIASQNDDISKLITSSIIPIFNKTINEYDLDTITAIAKSQQKAHDFSNDAYEEIKAQLQGAVDDIGIRIHEAYFEYL